MVIKHRAQLIKNPNNLYDFYSRLLFNVLKHIFSNIFVMRTKIIELKLTHFFFYIIKKATVQPHCKIQIVKNQTVF